VEPSQCSNTCFLVISLTPASSLIPIKKLPIHRLGKDVPCSHIKPPEGLTHWTLDQVYLTFEIRLLSQSSTSDTDTMLFESSTLLEDQVNMTSTKLAEINEPGQIVGMIDVALRLALTDLPPRALSGIKVTERSSFKHLDDICPAMWSPDHIEVFRTFNNDICCACAYTDKVFDRLLLHEQSSYPPSATPSPTLSHNEHTHFH
jgi:hypothetical protein